MTAAPDVTVVIPTHNRCELLQETIKSVSQQSMNRWELIVIDDASEDDTWSWLQNITDPRVELIRMEQNVERSKARNIGLGAAKGQFVLFLDDDDLLMLNALQIHVDALSGNPQCIVSVGNAVYFNESGWTHSKRHTENLLVRNIFEDLLFCWAITGGQCLMRTESVRAVGGWNEAYNFAEDLDLTLRLAERGPFLLTPEIVLQFRLHDEQWRPRDAEQLLLQIREAAAGRQSPESPRRLKRIIKGNQRLAKSRGDHRSGHYLRAVLQQIQALLSTPGVFGSPLNRPIVISCLMHSLASCFFAKHGSATLGRKPENPWRPKRVDPEGNVLPGQLDEIK